MFLNLTGLALSTLLGATSPTQISVTVTATDAAPATASGVVFQVNSDSLDFAKTQAEDQAQAKKFSEFVASRGPVASPRDTARATIGEAHVLVDYGRPSKRGRVIFGELVPFDSVWRTGANLATTLVTDKTLMIGDQTVPPGTYTLFTIPSKSGWQLMINKEVGQWGLTYHPEFNLGKTSMTTSSVTPPVEKFLIDFANGKMRMQWDTTVAEVSVAEKK